MSPDEVAALVVKPNITEAEMGAVMSALFPIPRVTATSLSTVRMRMDVCPALTDAECREADAAYARWANSGAKERYEFERACRAERADPTFGPRARGMT